LYGTGATPASNPFPTRRSSDLEDHPTYLILDLDPPEGDDFAHVVRAARLVHQALADSGLEGVVKTSGSKGLHVFVPLADDVGFEDRKSTRLNSSHVKISYAVFC